MCGCGKWKEWERRDFMEICCLVQFLRGGGMEESKIFFWEGGICNTLAVLTKIFEIQNKL